MPSSLNFKENNILGYVLFVFGGPMTSYLLFLSRQQPLPHAARPTGHHRFQVSDNNELYMLVSCRIRPLLESTNQRFMIHAGWDELYPVLFWIFLIVFKFVKPLIASTSSRKSSSLLYKKKHLYNVKLFCKSKS